MYRIFRLTFLGGILCRYCRLVPLVAGGGSLNKAPESQFNR